MYVAIYMVDYSTFMPLGEMLPIPNEKQKQKTITKNHSESIIVQCCLEQSMGMHTTMSHVHLSIVACVCLIILQLNGCAFVTANGASIFAGQ